MSVNLNRKKTEWETDRRTHKMKTILDLGPYDQYYCWSEPYPAQKRAYRSWKHNRKTQWKNGN